MPTPGAMLSPAGPDGTVSGAVLGSPGACARPPDSGALALAGQQISPPVRRELSSPSPEM